MSSEWPHNQPLPSSGWRRKFIREVDLTNTRWRCSFFQKQEMSRNCSGFWLSIPLSAHFWKKALAILFLAPSCEEKKYVQSSNWETTADSLLILFSALSCHPGSHQKNLKWPKLKTTKTSWEGLQNWATQPLAIWPKSLKTNMELLRDLLMKTYWVWWTINHNYYWEPSKQTADSHRLTLFTHLTFTT